MDERLQQVLEGKEENYLFPFLWIHKGYREELPGRIQKIYESGCRAFCVESRPHEDFGKQGWWEDMAVIFGEAKKRNMKVWILDDRHFPTGYANGILENRYRERRRWFLRAHHVDVVGPMEEACVLLPHLKEEEEEKILAAVAYRRADSGEILEGEGILITDFDQGFLFWNVPKGFYRIFFVIQTRAGSRKGQHFYINGLDAESVHALIEAVYEPHYTHFAEYFGNTLAGFFSDEPGFASQHIGLWGQDTGSYYRTVGQPGVALPWSDDVVGYMEKTGEESVSAEERQESVSTVLKSLPGLWYPIKDRSAQIRLSYMNTITKLWRKNFSVQLGEWCHAHGVWYVGHIVEDMNAHMRLGMGAGHYFRSLSGQDMSGIDIVLHQVLPGFAEYDAAARIANGTAGNAFFHYVLPKLGSSLARIEPQMQGRAMCEVFGAYGWAESTTCMKWLMDFLLVRGMNRFVPHAFNDLYPDPDCPPHFFGRGQNPQFEGFSKLMHYVNQVSHLLEGADMQTEGAVFYMAEAEWMSSPAYRTMDEVSKVLYDAHIDFDILSLDSLKMAEIQDQRLMVNGHAHSFLVIPYAERYPESLYKLAKEFTKKGLPVFWIEDSGGWEQKGLSALGKKMPLSQLIFSIRDRKLAWEYSERASHLRIGYFRRKEASWFMLFWEDVQSSIDEILTLPCQGCFLRLDLLNGEIRKDYTENGRVQVQLTPYQSELLLFDAFETEFLDRIAKQAEWKECSEPELLWEIALLELGMENEFQTVGETTELFSITGSRGWPRFSGRIRYRTKLWLDEKAGAGLELGSVGGNAKLTINGEKLGMRICPPYRWDISEAARDGENQIEVEVSNTLVHRLQDELSQFMQIGPSGIIGPVRLLQAL